MSHVDPVAQAEYNKILEVYKEAADYLAKIGDKLYALDIEE